jgi:hypothetical protein
LIERKCKDNRHESFPSSSNDRFVKGTERLPNCGSIVSLCLCYDWKPQADTAPDCLNPTRLERPRRPTCRHPPTCFYPENSWIYILPPLTFFILKPPHTLHCTCGDGHRFTTATTDHFNQRRLRLEARRREEDGCVFGYV